MVAVLLKDLEEHGIELEAVGDRLRYRPKSAMTPDLAVRVKGCKIELLAVLAGRVEPDPAADTGLALTVVNLSEDERETFAERAAVREYDGCQTREAAETAALLEVQAARKTAPGEGAWPC